LARGGLFYFAGGGEDAGWGEWWQVMKSQELEDFGQFQLGGGRALTPRVPCIYLVLGIYSFFALMRVAMEVGASPLFCCRR
jgi:hypothetical protein